MDKSGLETYKKYPKYLLGSHRIGHWQFVYKMQSPYVNCSAVLGLSPTTSLWDKAKCAKRLVRNNFFSNSNQLKLKKKLWKLIRGSIRILPRENSFKGNKTARKEKMSDCVGVKILSPLIFVTFSGLENSETKVSGS